MSSALCLKLLFFHAKNSILIQNFTFICYIFKLTYTYFYIFNILHIDIDDTDIETEREQKDKLYMCVYIYIYCTCFHIRRNFSLLVYS